MKIKITGLGILLLYLVFTAEIYSQVNDQSTSDWKEKMKEAMVLAASNVDSAEVLAKNLMEDSPYDKRSSEAHYESVMAEVYYYRQNFDQSMRSYRKALQLFLSIGDSSWLAEKSNASIGLKDVMADNLKDLYKAYFEMGNYKQANVILEQYHALKDSIFDDQKYERLIELEKKYHAEKSQKELTLLKAKEQKQQFILWGMSAFFLLCALLTFIWLYVMKIKERQKYTMMEHKVLRTQMNPHFIFNSLSALQCIIMENNQEEAIVFLSEFSTLMRQVLYYASEEQISLNKEREILEQYLRIQSKRFDPKINYHIEFDPLLNGDKVAVPPMLTQPFIENALEHGELNKQGNGTIDVRLRRVDQRLEFVVEDNGVGIDKAASSKMGRKHRSVAMKLTRERLALLNGDHKSQAVSLQITDLSSEGKHGTRVVFHIPYMEMN